jgi:hypothetical protein
MYGEERPFEGWYYRQDGQAVGPVATEQLQGLLATGHLLPRQAVWRQGRHGLVFLHATRAAGDPRAEGRQPSPPEPAPA